MAVRQSLYSRPREDALARAVLTFCLDGADALMYATVKGAGNAAEALRLLIESLPGTAGCDAAMRKLEGTFLVGLSRWGRKPDNRAVKVFRRSVEGWHARLGVLPSLDWHGLEGWFTMDGSQWLIGPQDAAWPAQLTDLSTHKDWAAPLCLWGMGDARALTSCASPVAVVGSRGVTDYGRLVAREVAARAASDGHLIVSGGALGTDAAAHWGALDAVRQRGLEAAGRTVAVFAGGLNHIGPSSNMRLFEAMREYGGALISEMCPDTIPEARRFLLRNRIIAALSSTVVVAQARVRSGALNTAGWGNDLDRVVLAAPGEITAPNNAGCNRLISRAEAIILTSTSGITEFCHAPHEPVFTDRCGMDGAAHTSSGMVGADGAASAGNADGTDNAKRAENMGLSASQRDLIGAIRSCNRRRMHATPDALLAALNGGAPASERIGIGQVMADIGALEARGLLRYDGVATLV
ncbi:DNA-protecting protein DprA [Bifidobacterium sp. 64T4]|uniref:DNA-processing protein DprA n=1 Tax=Bifidobacterium pongonis TaxID=2834432 RepID=UPI001C59F518|nr:DNA-processing protein DprA [Bifidobacterium pongonis]MBW3095323.1 DNA-protecting protein DprA [Bifidobacterium pongonis]